MSGRNEPPRECLEKGASTARTRLILRQHGRRTRPATSSPASKLRGNRRIPSRHEPSLAHQATKRTRTSLYEGEGSLPGTFPNMAGRTDQKKRLHRCRRSFAMTGWGAWVPVGRRRIVNGRRFRKARAQIDQKASRRRSSSPAAPGRPSNERCAEVHRQVRGEISQNGRRNCSVGRAQQAGLPPDRGHSGRFLSLPDGSVTASVATRAGDGGDAPRPKRDSPEVPGGRLRRRGRGALRMFILDLDGNFWKRPSRVRKAQ